jgi:hypothetical protein
MLSRRGSRSRLSPEQPASLVVRQVWIPAPAWVAQHDGGPGQREHRGQPGQRGGATHRSGPEPSAMATYARSTRPSSVTRPTRTLHSRRSRVGRCGDLITAGECAGGVSRRRWIRRWCPVGGYGSASCAQDSPQWSLELHLGVRQGHTVKSVRPWRPSCFSPVLGLLRFGPLRREGPVLVGAAGARPDL